MSPNTMRSLTEDPDISTMVKTSRAVSREIVHETLVRVLMTMAVEHAAAERGLLILLRGDGQGIVAEAITGRDTVEVRLLQAVVTPAHLPEWVLHHVIRLQESVLLDDASAPNRFSADEYIHATHVRSILCLPLVRQAKLIGVLYLESHRTPNVFTPERVAVLRLLASQAAVLLDDGRLYAGPQAAEGRFHQDEWELRLAVGTIPEFVWNALPDGHIDFLIPDSRPRPGDIEVIRTIRQAAPESEVTIIQNDPAIVRG